MRYEPLTGEPVAAVVRAGHPLLERAPLARADAQRAAWVVPPAGSVLRRRVERMFQRASLTPPANVVETAALLFVTRTDEVYAPAAGVTIEAIRDAAREIYTVAA
ncbi:lysR substrate binding domain protein [Burkholderia pseudomallei MSHR1328]|nr:galactose-binding protein [Burkholderia pseudomallei]KGW57599.1 lysR substrate binding domain protein [Burkholderia pseudomallei MSHR1357]KKC12655.1 lysR substrate binding domain protein [Burkholderia pseudomallei MSHR1328]ONA04670.1 galactose-binding protein [Burkholderia pseudomallei]ONC01357.1 galactose-binding protein [Burkholderia pseudomallei]